MPESCHAGASAHQLVRRVTAFTAACVLVSNMIGTGIFGTTGFMARDIGSPPVILLLWLTGGGFALLGAFCYGELGAAIPRAGGEYVYIREAYGPLWGFLSGWVSFTIGFSAAIAANAHLFATHLHQLFPVFQEEVAGNAILEWSLRKTTGLTMIWALTLVHVLGVGAGGFVQRALTVIKVGCIVLLVLAGLAVGRGDWGNLATGNRAAPFDLTTVAASFLFVTFSYAGWNAASYIAGEMKDPGRSLPRAMIWGTVCVGVLYLALNLVYFYALPTAALAGDPVPPVAQKSSVALFGPAAGRWITAILCVSILGAASAMIWTGPRVYYAMAQDRVFPAMFAETTASTQAPAKSIILQSLWVSALALIATFEQLLIYTSFVLMVFAALAVGAVIVLRARRPELDRPYRVFAYPLVPILYLVICLAVMWAALDRWPIESLLGVATVLAGVPFYFYWKRRASGLEAQSPSD